jgi:hypothetical protein
MVPRMTHNDQHTDQERIIFLEDRCAYLDNQINNLYAIIEKHMKVTAMLAGLSPAEYEMLQATATQQVMQEMADGSHEV